MKKKFIAFVVAGGLALWSSASVSAQEADLSVSNWIHIGEGNIPPAAAGGLVIGGGGLTFNAPDSIVVGSGAWGGGTYLGIDGSIGLNFVMGLSARSYGSNCFAFGNEAVAFTNQGFVTSDSFAFAVGHNAYADTNSVAMGQNANALGGQGSVAFGNFSRAEGRSVALGSGATATGGGNAFGRNSFATGFNSVALGAYFGGAYGHSSVAIGHYAAAEGDKSAAFGYSARAFGHKSFAVGPGILASGAGTFALGKYNLAASYGLGLAPEQVGSHFFEIGNGTDLLTRSNALVLTHGGDFQIPWQKAPITNTPPSEDEKAADNAFEVKSDGTIIIGKVQGDISMGVFATSGQ